MIAGCAAALLLVRWAVLVLRPAWEALRLSGLDDQRGLEHLVVVVCAAVLAGISGWLLLSLVVCSADALRRGGIRTDVGGVLRPRLVAALVSSLVGTLVVAGSGAGAEPGPGTGRPSGTGLDGLSLPDRPFGGVRTHRVAPGESLWSITEDALPDRATDSQVGRAWPRLHRLNRGRVGPDPDLIRPGTTLRLPAWASAATRGAAR